MEMDPHEIIRNIYERHYKTDPHGNPESPGILSELQNFKLEEMPYLRLTFGVEVEMLAFRADGSNVVDVKENILDSDWIKGYNQKASEKYNDGELFEYIGFDHYAENYDAHKNPLLEFRTAPFKNVPEIAFQFQEMVLTTLKAIRDNDKGEDLVIVPCAIPFWKNYPNLSAGMHIHIGNSSGNFLKEENKAKWSSIFYSLACITYGVLPRGFNGYSPSDTAYSQRLDGDVALQLMHPGDWGNMLNGDLSQIMNTYNEELDKMVPIALRKKTQTIEYRFFDTPLLLWETMGLVNLVATLATAAYNDVGEVIIHEAAEYKKICQKMWKDPIESMGYIANGGMDWKYGVIWDKDANEFIQDYPLSYIQWLFETKKFKEIWLMLAADRYIGEKLGFVLDEFPPPYKITKTLSDNLSEDKELLMQILFEFFKSWGYVGW